MTTRLGTWTPIALLRCAHPTLGLVTAVGLAGAAALSGRSSVAVGMVLATAVVGQAVLGWHNDLVDRARDASHARTDKPLVRGDLDPSTVWFWLAVAVMLVVPLAVFHGVWAGVAYLGSLLVGILGNLVLRGSWLSWLPWATSFALYPAFLAYGGWAGQGRETPPELTVTVLAALLGVCVHVLVALPGLVADNQDGRRHLPLRIALRIGAPRLLWATVVVTVLMLGGLLAEGARVGLTQ
ncbi:UbiA family prenyltransferase [Nocardioides sp. GXQ0305]|uniref:UbiA family prenyltransferase n=1 Tax=Nocardioides sp. GXQ0305 TaxID=3423912 RepID=UPI003D7E189D